MKCQLSCGCCGPDNCLKLWTPKRPDGDVCDWFLNVDGDIDIPWPGASWSMVRRPSDGGEIADASTLYCGFRTKASVTCNAPADDVAIEVEYPVEHSAGFDLALPAFNEQWPESKFPACSVSAQKNGGASFGPDALTVGSYVPPAGRTVDFSGLMLKAGVIFDTMETVQVAGGPNGDGATHPVQVFYNGYLGKGGMDIRGTNRHLGTDYTWPNGQFYGLHSLFFDSPIWAGIGGIPYMGVLQGRPNNFIEIDETSFEASANVGYTKRASFADGVVSASVDGFSQYANLRYRHGGYAMTGMVVNSSTQDAVVGSLDPTCGYDPALHTGMGSLYYSKYKGSYTNYIGRAWDPQGYPNNDLLSAQALMTALGQAYDDDLAYVMAVRTYVGPVEETFTIDSVENQVGSPRPDQWYDPTSPYYQPSLGYYITGGNGENGNIDIKFLAATTFDYVYGSSMTSWAIPTNPHTGETIGFSDSAPDPKDWKRRAEFSFSAGREHINH